MNVSDLLTDPMAYGFMQRGMLAALMVGIVCAVMGTFVVLKGLAFIGDAVSHAAFPGLVIATCWASPLSRRGHRRGAHGPRHRLASRAAAAFGSIPPWASCSRGRSRSASCCSARRAATRPTCWAICWATSWGSLRDDLLQLAVLGTLVAGHRAVLRKELLFATFDPAGAAASGLPVGALDYGLLALLGVTIVVSIQAVGHHPGRRDAGHARRDRTAAGDRFGSLMVLAASIAVVSAVVGLYPSFYANLASGASIVLVETLAFAAALLLGPKSGVLANRRASSPSLPATG